MPDDSRVHVPDEGMADVVTRLRTAGCVFAENEARLIASAARSPEHLAELVDRRVSGRPLEHILGWAEFCGLRLAVSPGVFVPRHRTELLVREAVALASSMTPGPAVVVDLCCGCGAVGAVIARDVPGVELHVTDIDPAAARCARRNLGGDAQVYVGDLFAPLPDALRGRVAVLAANTPYVPTGEIRLLPPEARLYEARAAVDGGHDGLDVMRRVAAAAPGWLAPGGHLVMEASRLQAPRTATTMERAGLVAGIVTSDELDATVVVGANRST